MNAPTREQRISVVARVIAGDIEVEAIEVEEGRRRGYTGRVRHGCLSDGTVCEKAEWASCICFVQACEVVDALDAIERPPETGGSDSRPADQA